MHPDAAADLVVLDCWWPISFCFCFGQIAQAVDQRLESLYLVAMNSVERAFWEAQIAVLPNALCELFDCVGVSDFVSVHQQCGVVVLSSRMVLFPHPDIPVITVSVMLE